MNKNFLFLVSFTLLTSIAFAQDNFSYEFPGCNGGGGTWPAGVIEVPNEICAQTAQNDLPVLEAEFMFGGHCNGRLTLKAACSVTQTGKIQSVDIKDCFCD